MSRPETSTELVSGRESGFTLIELISVLIVVGVIAAVVFPRMASTTAFQQRILTDQLSNLVLEARQFAQSRQRQGIALEIRRQQDWQIRILLDADNNAEFEQALAIEQLTGTPELTLSGAQQQRLSQGDRLRLYFDQLGNIVRINDQPMRANLYIQAAENKSLCISPAGLAWNASQEACEHG